MNTTGYYYRQIETYLADRFLRFALNRHTSLKRRISAGVLQGNKLGPISLIDIFTYSVYDYQGKNLGC